MILAIDTSGPNQILIFKKGKTYIKKWQNTPNDSEELLSKIQELLDQSKGEISQIKTVLIYPGPGSYTGIRVGFAVANTLGFIQKIDIFAAKSKNLNKEIEGFLSNLSFSKNPKPIYK